MGYTSNSLVLWIILVAAALCCLVQTGTIMLLYLPTRY